MISKKTIKNIRLNYFETLLYWRIPAFARLRTGRRLRWRKIILIIIFVFSSFLVFAHLSSAQTAGQGIEEACVAGNCCCVTKNICFISDGKDCTGKIQVKACSELSDCTGKIIANKGENPVIFTPQIKIPGLSDVIAVGSGTFASYIGAFYKWSVVAIAILAVIMIMISGINWIFAAGNPTAIKSAQDRFTAALIGLVLVLICIPLLSLINPALVKLSTLKIPGITRIEVGMDIDFKDLLSPPDEWFDVDMELSAGDKACGKEVGYKKETFFGVVCDTALNFKNICYLPFEIVEDDLEAWNKGEEKDFADLIILREEVKGNKPGCFVVAPGNKVWVPAEGGEKTTLYFDANRPCGEVKSDYVGTKCQFAGETCVISAIWEVDEDFNETGTSEWDAICLPVAVEKTCPAYEIRVSCVPNCGFPEPPQGCMDVPVEELLATDKICCQDANKTSRIR